MGESHSSVSFSCACADLNRLNASFITTVSHEVRTPLSVILLAVELLKLHGQNCTEAQRQLYLGQIQHAAKEINALFNLALPTIGGDLAQALPD